MNCPCDYININDNSVPHELNDDGCDIIHQEFDDGADICQLIDQYYTLYKQVIKEQRNLCCPSISDIKIHDIHSKSEHLLQDVKGSILELEREESESNQDQYSEKHVHFETGGEIIIDDTKQVKEKESDNKKDAPPADVVEVKDQNVVEVKSEDLVKEEEEAENLSAEEKVEEMLKKLEDKKELMKEKYQKEIERKEDLKNRLKTQKDNAAQYEKRFLKHCKILSKTNKENEHLCQEINDALQELKGKQRQYEKSSRIWDLSTLHRTQKQLRNNEYHILMVRNLELKIEIKERNSERLKKAIKKQHRLMNSDSQTLLEDQSGKMTLIQHLRALNNYVR